MLECPCTTPLTPAPRTQNHGSYPAADELPSNTPDRSKYSQVHATTALVPDKMEEIKFYIPEVQY